MDLYFEIAGGQIDGARDYQEDAYLTTYIDDEGEGPKSAALVVMADGMGGHAAGNIASNLVVSTFNSTFTGAFGKGEVSTILRDALIKANNGLAESIRETPALDGMGCTMVAGALCKGKAWWVSVGDSHLYLIRDRELVKKNEDHSYGGYLDRMAAQGMDVEPEPGLSRNMLMSAMTGEDIAEIDCPIEPLQLLAGDRLIVASDGLDTLGTGTVIQMSAWSQTPKECVEAMLKAVEDAAKPCQDNTTIVVIDCVQRDAPKPAPAPPPEPTPADPHFESTQPLELVDIQEALKGTVEPPPMHRESDYAADGEAKSRSGLLMSVLVLLVLLGAAYFAYTSGLFGSWFGDADTAPPPQLSPAPVASSPVPTSAPAPTTAPAAAPTSPSVPTAPPDPGRVPGTGVLKTIEDVLVGGGNGPQMIVIPSGSFEMGSSTSLDDEERPVHSVEISSIAVGKYEVTVEEFRVFAKASGKPLHPALANARDNHPVTYVSWDEALAYTKWLSKQTGKLYRLPSESEWEYFARAGSSEPYWWGFGFKARKAHCFDCDTGLDPRTPTSVGRFDANPFGLHDTAGNVLEWVYDCYHSSYDGAPGDGGVFEGGRCEWRVARGGSFSQPSTSLRSAKRAKRKSTKRFDNVGFRVVSER